MFRVVFDLLIPVYVNLEIFSRNKKGFDFLEQLFEWIEAGTENYSIWYVKFFFEANQILRDYELSTV